MVRLAASLVLLFMTTVLAEDTCEADGTCRPLAVCGVHRELCESNSRSLYRHGGSAQAYAPEAPIKSTVCEDGPSKRKVASWPFSRSKQSSVKLVVRAHIWSCGGMSDMECCCENLNNTAKAEVWQARPDGTYSSPRDSSSGECRATVLSKDGWVSFTTLAPGSSGSLGGLGPSGWDMPPFGPPVMHMLLTADNHQPLLIHIPVLFHSKTYERRSFWGPDFRGHVGRRTAQSDAYNITQWNISQEDAHVQVELDIFLTKGPSPDIRKDMCPWYMYGLPSAFFVEPIAVCAPYLFDFFPL